jgi:hypothetical protein
VGQAGHHQFIARVSSFEGGGRCFLASQAEHTPEVVDRSKPERNYSAVPTSERHFRLGTVKHQTAILDKLADRSTIGPKKAGRKNNPPKVTSWRTRDLAGVPDNVQSLTIKELQGALIGLAQEHRAQRFLYWRLCGRYSQLSGGLSDFSHTFRQLASLIKTTASDVR